MDEAPKESPSTDGVDERVARLTEGQRECLRLVRLHKTSKEIARELGISKATADQRLRAAVDKLGAASRTEAALIYARATGEVLYDRVSYAPVDVDAGANTPPDKGRLDEADILDQVELAEAQAPYWPPASTAEPLSFLPPPFRQGRHVRLSLSHRIAWLILLTLGIGIMTGVMLAGLEALGRVADNAF